MVAELGRAAEREAGAGERRLYLTCTMQGMSYLVPTAPIREVEAIGAVTPVPHTPPWLRGVMNLRGEIVAVIDLVQFLGLPRESGPGTEALICTDGDLIVALAVDTVSAIRPLAAEDILPLPEQHLEGLREAAGRYLVGLHRVQDELLGVLDLVGLLRALGMTGTAGVDGAEPPRAGEVR